MWLQCCKHQSNNHNAKWKFRQNSLHKCIKTQPTAISNSHVTALYVLETSISSNASYMLQCKVVHMHIEETYVSIYASYKLTSIKSVTRNTSNTYMSDYWHMPLNKYTYHTAHFTCTTALLF